MTELANQIDELLDAARYGDCGDVQVALDEYKVSPDAADDQQRTGLHMACANGHIDVVNLLLDRGANYMAENKEGNTPLHWACLNGQEQIVRLLMEKGASPSAVNLQGRTPVDEALGRPHQDRILAVVGKFGTTTDDLDREDDPEAQETEDMSGDDPALKPYDKYGVQ